jgi:lysylphosphatidylglycerol synthetase-like protein (DUF2156 family)
VCWTRSRDAAILYRVVNGVALASGDPLGPRTAWPAAVTDWLTLAHRHAWVPAVTNAGPAAAVVYEAAGFHGFASGDEAVVDAERFTSAFASPAGVNPATPAAIDPASPAGGDSAPGAGLDPAGSAGGSSGPGAGGDPDPGAGEDSAPGPGGGPGEPADEGARPQAGVEPDSRARHEVVQVAAAGGGGVAGLAAAHRLVGDAGYTAAFRRQSEVGDDEWQRFGQLADAWRRHPAERGFSVALGRLGDPADGDCLLAECRDPHGRTCALLGFVPWGHDGLTLDLMRHDRESGRAPVDYLLTELLVAAARGDVPPLAGVTRVSLNFTAFRSAASRRGPLRLLTRHWSLAERERSYEAYAPRWQPRYVLYERRTDVPRVAAANAVAEGFLTAARLRRRSASLTRQPT